MSLTQCIDMGLPCGCPNCRPQQESQRKPKAVNQQLPEGYTHEEELALVGAALTAIAERNSDVTTDFTEEDGAGRLTGADLQEAYGIVRSALRNPEQVLLAESDEPAPGEYPASKVGWCITEMSDGRWGIYVLDPWLNQGWVSADVAYYLTQQLPQGYARESFWKALGLMAAGCDPSKTPELQAILESLLKEQRLERVVLPSRGSWKRG